MNAVQALSLRKPTRGSSITGAHTTNDQMRFKNRKSNIKDILARNFLRKHPIDQSLSDSEQLQIERTVTNEIDEFVSSTREINTRNLHEFEAQLAKKVNLNKQTQNNERRYKSGQNARGATVDALGVSGQNAGSSGGRDNFMLPDINQNSSVAHLVSKGQGSNNLAGSQRRTTRRSQIALHTQKGSQTVKNEGNEQRNRHMSKLLSQNMRQKKGGATLQHSSSKVRQNQIRPADRNRSQANMASNNFQNELNRQALDSLQKADILGSAERNELRGVNDRPSAMSTRKNINKTLPNHMTRSQVVDDIPSDISMDEWGEIQRFGQKLHEEQIKKQKNDHNNRIRQVREVLDQQVKVRNELREKQLREKKEFEERLVKAARDELAAEERKKEEKLQKTLKAKAMRDVMLKEAKDKQIRDQLRRQEEEKRAVDALQKELQDEKIKKAENKKKTREAAMKVIKENQEQKKIELAKAEEQARKEQEEIEKMVKKNIEAEEARDKAMADRAARISKIMDSMGDQIVQKDKELEKKQERDYIKQCLERDEQARQQDLKKKQEKRTQAQKINEILDQQRREKQEIRDKENKAARSYMNRWTEQMEKDNRKQTEKEELLKKKKAENQQFLKNQMETLGGAKHGSDALHRRKYMLGGMMNEEEARMNRNLLKEIARAKRGDEPTAQLASASKSPL